MEEPQQAAPLWRVVAAWAVHAYTASGLIIAALMLEAIVFERYSTAFWMMFLACLVDATDGTLARLVRVKEVLPGFDGRRLDDIIDFLTYTVLPLFLIWQAKLLYYEFDWVIVIPLIASAYGFCQTNAKTDDGYFLGFPSYWNIVAFYLYYFDPTFWFDPVLDLMNLQWPPRGLVSVGILLVFATLTFVPLRYLYPTQRGPINLISNLLAVPWMCQLILILWIGDRTKTQPIVAASTFYPIYYLAASWWVSWQHFRCRVK